MEYICPHCGDNLKRRLMKSFYYYLNKDDLLAIYSTPACPNCGASLVHKLDEIEKALFKYFSILFAVFFISILLLTILGIRYNPLWSIFVGVVIFGAFIGYASWFHGIKVKGSNYWDEAKNSNKAINHDAQ